MGAIDVGVDRALDRRIAVKTLHPHLRSDDSTLRMFLREARITALLDHPHIVPVYDIGERADEQLYFAMKLVEGETLAAIIRAFPRGALDTATLYGVLDIVTKVCDALAFAHSRGVLHCDIKPANVMVGEFGQVYLMDWGIARLIAVDASPASMPNPKIKQTSASATDNSVIGTPCYMSPEQARGDRSKLDARSDVFLIGAMLYEMLTRRPPYQSSDRIETIALAASGVFPTPRKVAGEAGVPAELDRIVMRAMAKSPDDRYPDVSALKEDLVRFMRGGAEFPKKTFAAGDVIVQEGESGDAAYIIVEGRCEIRKQMPSGEQTLREIGPGDVFGEMAIMTEGPRTASVVAIEQTTVLVVTSTVLEEEMAALKPWIATLLRSFAKRFREMDTHHRATYSATPEPARLANQILMHIMTWGERAGDACSMKWSVLSDELEAQLGLPPLTAFAVASRYGLVLDVEADKLTIPDAKALAVRLRKELSL
jgi:serine/threonine-protein kinase